jgi:antitoxin ParD1/3/4
MKSTTTSVNVSMPAKLKKVMQKRMAAGGFENASEYLRHLIRMDALPRVPDTHEELEAELLAGLNSGPGIEVNEKFWQDLKKHSLQDNGRSRSKRKSA